MAPQKRKKTRLAERTRIKKEQVLALRDLPADGMSALVDTTKRALLKTVDLLSTEFNVYSWDFLPYEALAIILCYVHAKTGNALTVDQVIRVRQWFWRSAFTERYRGASEHFISNDLERIHEFVVNKKGKPEQFGGAPADDDWKETVFQRNFSRSRAFVLALAAKKPRNLTNGSVIDIAEALSIYNQKEFHHVHPKAHLKKLKAPGEHNAIVNICMLAASENKAISDKDPTVYLPDCIARLGSDADAVLCANLLPTTSQHNYGTADYASFVNARAPLITKLVADLCDGKTV